jgi:hypothetical protein
MLQHFWDHIFVINIFWLLPTFFRNVPTFFENVGFVNYFFGDILQNVAIFFFKNIGKQHASADGRATPFGARCGEARLLVSSRTVRRHGEPAVVRGGELGGCTPACRGGARAGVADAARGASSGGGGAVAHPVVA